MSSLLVDLYKYRERESRNSLEDFSTEVLCAIMRSLPRSSMADFLEGLTGQKCAAALSNGSNVHIETQRMIVRDGGRRQRPDIVVSIENQPWLVFENKVSAGLSEEQRVNGEGEVISQLHRYAEWLRAQAPELQIDGLKRALVFITHDTPVPEDFRSATGHPSYEGLSRRHTTWAQIGRALSHSCANLSLDSHAAALVNAFQIFLEENGMSQEYPTSSDVSLLGVFLPAYERLERLVNDMLYRVESIGPATGNRDYATPNSEPGLFDATRWIKVAGWPDKLFVCVGLWFPDAGDGWHREDLESDEITITSAPKVFIQLARDVDEGGLEEIEGKPGNLWHRPDTDFVAFCDFDSFIGSADDRHNAILGWLDARRAELVSFMADRLQ